MFLGSFVGFEEAVSDLLKFIEDLWSFWFQELGTPGVELVTITDLFWVEKILLKCSKTISLESLCKLFIRLLIKWVITVSC